MKLFRGFLIIILIIGLIGCSTTTNKEMKPKVGLLLTHNIDDKGWNSKGYQGLLNIQANLDVDVMYKEEINTREKVLTAIEEYVSKETRLIFGHGQMYTPIFMEIKDQYPEVHFVTFNSKVTGDNITGVHFEGYAMGFFAGMLASSMSESKCVGIIAAYPTQPEVKGFLEGAKFQNGATQVKVDFISSWVDTEKAMKSYKKMVENGVDVFYPTGDGYHVPIVEQVKKDGLYVIGFVSDHSDLGYSTVLTSTIQHVDQLYEIIAKEFFNEKLESGNKYFDFGDGVITLGEFSSVVPKEIQTKINNAVNLYIESGKLPNEY